METITIGCFSVLLPLFETAIGLIYHTQHVVFRITSYIATAGSVNTGLRHHITKTYGLPGEYASYFIPSFPHFIEMAEARVLDGTEESITKFRKDQEVLLANAGTTAAIISQVTITSLQLDFVGQTHWIVRALFYSSVVLSLLSVYMSFLKHREITSLDNRDIRSRFKSANQGSTPFKPTKLNLNVVLALHLPYAFLTASITIYFVSISLFLLFSWLSPPDVDGKGIENRKIFIVFILSLLVGYAALGQVQRSRSHVTVAQLSRSEQREKVEAILNDYSDHVKYLDEENKEALLFWGSKILGYTSLHLEAEARAVDFEHFMKVFEDIEYTSTVTRPHRLHRDQGFNVTITDGSESTAQKCPNCSEKLLKAMTEAAEANKAAAAAMLTITAQLERIAAGCSVPTTFPPGDSSQTTATVDVDSQDDAITSVVP